MFRNTLFFMKKQNTLIFQYAYFGSVEVGLIASH
jgi:hypothetical protein